MSVRSLSTYVSLRPYVFATLVGFTLFAGCGAGTDSVSTDVTEVVQRARAEGPVHFVVLHTNDIHGKYTTTEATWKDGNPPIGGFANLSAVVNATRANTENVLLLDAGDLMTGNPICDYHHMGAKGGAMMEFMNLLQYDAMCLGNHEFDHGLDELDKLVALAEFPVLSTNTYRPEGGLTAPVRNTIIHRGGLDIGIIGIMTENLYGVAAPSKLAGTVVTDMVEETKKVVQDLDPITDLIILLTHVGLEDDKVLAREVPNIDMIIGGHSHTRLQEPDVVNGVIVAQTGAHNRNVGEIRITVENDRITRHAGGLIELWPTPGGNEKVGELIAQYDEVIEKEFGRVIGELAVDWRRAGQAESNIGNWLAEAIRVDQDGDFGVLNSGGIRKNMSAGPIRRLDVVEILPFSNMVTKFEVTGDELLAIMKNNAHAMAFKTHGILQMAGLRFTYRVVGEDVELVDTFVGGKPVDPAATYTGVGVDYVTHGNAAKYLGLEPARRETTGEVLSAVIVRAIEAADGAITGEVDQRMKDVTVHPESTGTAG
jgi:2',3'-cyclic-nucleotide 2'-phosphodiesterase (5'-nucleotidase family)